VSLSVSEGMIPMLLLLLRVEETQRLVLGVTDGLLLCLESLQLLPQEVELLLIVVLLSLQTLYRVFLSRLRGDRALTDLVREIFNMLLSAMALSPIIW
jgi:hypothetical protein